MAYKIQARRDTATNWTTVNPVLANGEFGYETDSGKLKMGDGTTAWSSLTYWNAGAGDVTGPTSSTDDNIATFDLATGKLIQDSGINISAVVANTAKNTYPSADATKLSNIEANADVTDEANVTTALNGATLGAVTVSATDKVLIQDTSDSDSLKTVTAQSIADLGGGGGGISNPFDQNMSIQDCTTYYSTINEVKFMRWVPKFDMTVTDLALLVINVGSSENAYVGIYSDDLATLHTSGSGWTSSTGVAKISVTNYAVTGGTPYWLAMKLTNGSGNVGMSVNVFGNIEICREIYNASSGLPSSGTSSYGLAEAIWMGVYGS